MPRHLKKKRDRRPRYGGKRSLPKHRAPRDKPSSGEFGDLVRLQKVLAAAGIGSRRQCEELIREGRVDVDGQTVAELGTRVDPDRQQIRVDGEPVRRAKRVYFAVNKPVGILSTNRDPAGRPRVIDFAPGDERMFTVGRLDKSSEGLILVTNDGRLTDLLTHPRYGVEKTYLAEVVGVPSTDALNKLRQGVHFAEGYAHAKEVRVRSAHRHSTILEIVLDEGRNREVRRLLARIGHKVVKLRRVAMGSLRLGNLQPGETRPLSHEEIEALYETARQGRKGGKAARVKKLKPAGSSPVESVAKSVTPIIDYSLPISASDSGDWTSAGNDESLDTAAADAESFDSSAVKASISSPKEIEVNFNQHATADKRNPRHRTIIGGDSGGPSKSQASGGRKRRERRGGKARGRSRQRRRQ